MASMNFNKLILKGYESNDHFAVVGRNGSTLVQPGPDMTFPSITDHYSEGRGTVVKDSSENKSNLSFKVVQESDYRKCSYRSDRDYMAASFRLNSGLYYQDSSMFLYGMDDFVRSMGNSGYTEQNYYYWLFPYEQSSNPRGDIHIVGNGGNSVDVQISRSGEVRRLHPLSPVSRVEIYVVVSLRYSDNAGLSIGYFTELLDKNVARVYVPFQVSGTNYKWELNKVRSLSQGNLEGNAIQVWAYSSNSTINGLYAFSPVLLMCDDATQVGAGSFAGVRLNVETTYVFKGA